MRYAGRDGCKGIFWGATLVIPPPPPKSRNRRGTVRVTPTTIVIFQGGKDATSHDALGRARR
jgi:hypothetical protein